MPFIRLKEPSSPTKHQLDDVEWDHKVSEIKDKAFRLTNIPALEQSKYKLYLVVSIIAHILFHILFGRLQHFLTYLHAC